MSYTDYLLWKSQPLTEPVWLSVVIPAFNEEERIVPTIGAIAAHLCDKGWSWELIVVDDGSTDATAATVADLNLANLRLIRLPANVGKGQAIRTGVMAAYGDYILFTDADNSTPIEEIDGLLATMQAQTSHLVVGSRAMPGAEELAKTPVRRLVSWGLRRLTGLFLNLHLRDTQCGFKLYTRDTARFLHEQQTLDGFSFDLELLYLAQKFGYSVAESPVTWVEAPGSKVAPMREALRFVRDVFKIRANDWRGNYELRTDENQVGHCHCVPS